MAGNAEAGPTSVTATAQENQLPIPVDIPVEDGAYPTPATAKAQENQLPIPVDIPVEGEAHPILVTAGNSERNRRPLESSTQHRHTINKRPTEYVKCNSAAYD
jgi:hypothetical protein